MRPCRRRRSGPLAVALCLLLLPLATRQDAGQFEQYEPARNVCETRCQCRRTEDALTLDCTGRGMRNVLAAWPSHPAHLVASFSRNDIAELKPVPPSDAVSIALSFRHCGLRTLRTQLFIDATGIEFLDLSWNTLEGSQLQPDTFRGRYNEAEYEPIGLRELVLAHNDIRSLPWALFEHTPNLTRLDLGDNPLQVVDPQLSHAISSNLRLAVLSLSNTSIARLPEDTVSRLRSLRALDLSRNRFPQVPDALALLSTSLELLRFDDNPVSYLNDTAFMGLNRLRELNISAMRELKSIRHNTFSKLFQLRAVHCSGNKKLQHLHHEAFGVEDNRPGVQELYLADNDLTTLAQHLLDWSQVRVLELAGNRWQCDCPLYHTMLEIHTTNTALDSAAATCVQPAAGVKLFDVSALNRSCVRQIGTRVEPAGAQGRARRHYVKLIMAVVCVCLILASAVVFYRIVLKYRHVRSVHMAYPVVYTSAPTTGY